TVNVHYSSGIAKFVKQIIVESGTRFIGGGDSGSLLVTDNADLNPVGLLFAGNSDGTMAIANRIDLVLDRFGVIVDGEAPPPPTTGLIGGTVTNASGGAAIAGVTISLDTGQSTTTAGDGSYTITDVPTGDRSVTASADGFESQSKTATVNENQTTIIDFALNEAPAAPTLSVSVTTNKDSYVNKEQAEITVTVTNPVEGAAVNVEITTAKGRKLSGSGTTDESGVLKLTYRVNSKRDGVGTYEVDATASKAGFESGSGSTTFEVTE
ncbi:MAG: carboxypeptidase regulatory-like domain-containing protein, partial [Candidatus Marinimicrobia bacterium]|nr:carboxypeptidase regulatory-like domain-containing protein [Candidatus Neomarinimicrobiota bacterium]